MNDDLVFFRRSNALISRGVLFRFRQVQYGLLWTDYRLGSFYSSAEYDESGY